MGFLDDVQASINRGVAATSRAGNTVKLKAQMNDALKRRQGLAAQLGASLYEATKEDPAFRAGREELYDGIAACDVERANCQVEIDRLEAEGAAQMAAAQVYECPFCHSRVAATSLFCSGCGKSMAEIQAAYGAAAAGTAGASAAGAGATGAVAADSAPFGTCPACGAPVQNAGDAFCMGCGARLDAAPAATPPAENTAAAFTPPEADNIVAIEDSPAAEPVAVGASSAGLIEANAASDQAQEG